MGKSTAKFLSENIGKTISWDEVKKNIGTTKYQTAYESVKAARLLLPNLIIKTNPIKGVMVGEIPNINDYMGGGYSERPNCIGNLFSGAL